MNSTINETFYTCSTESLFLRHKKISNKPVKLGSFLQCSVHIFLVHIFLYFYLYWYVLGSIRKLIIELYVLQWLFVRESNKKQRGDRVISNFTKGETFHLLWQPTALGGNLTMWTPSLHLLRKAFISLAVWPRRECTWILNWKESLLIYFENCQDVPYSY